jgi:hypothetical protein
MSPLESVPSLQRSVAKIAISGRDVLGDAGADLYAIGVGQVNLPEPE